MFDWDEPLDKADVKEEETPPTEEKPALEEAAEKDAYEAPVVSTWRCVIRPRMVVREYMSSDAPAVRGLVYGEEVQVQGKPMNGWVKLVDGGFAMIQHESLGELLRWLSPELSITVILDRAAETSASLTVPRGTTIGALKEQLAALDETGFADPRAFHLCLPSAGGLEDPQPLSDDSTVDDEHAELEVAARSSSGDSRASVDWEAVREDSSKRILASVGKPYEVLDLAPGSSSAEVRRAYHRLALLHHPDKGGDPEVFRAVGDAYRALTQARDESGGWRDLERQAVGPWPGHTEMVKGVNVVLFDCFSVPPWESRRLYSGAFQEGSVRCWELSKGEPGKVQPPPRLVGEIHSGGFLNDVALLSPFGLLTAQSAGMKPQPGESLRSWNLSITPFRMPNKKVAAITSGGSQKALADSGRAGGPKAKAVPEMSREEMLAKVNDALAEIDEGEYEPHADAGEDLMKSTMIFQHYRGVRNISLWPKAESRDAVPQFAATISKDWLALWKVSMHGLGLDVPCLWKGQDPAGGADPTALKHESKEKLWTLGNDCRVKCWDVNAAPGRGPVFAADLKSSSWVTGMQLWPGPGVMVCSHASGILFFDMRAGKLIRNQFTKSSVGGVSLLHGDSPMLFAGIGNDLMQYDTRLWREGNDYKPKGVGSWTLRSRITALHCTETRKGHVLVACGCENGNLAAFDTT
mmetsp:Transcript_69367/g.206597  ORF Transcript_69367/g.206597 Transcript_69367/m.206597 type:complete len:693 (-) Transcript_69367:122-2200(-)|eukprot:CAMPEP_0175225080 /NCGR_PEP_ID=MMETSP0093-20121207/22187_1 /TAXON_ID=311494 /ORGANISM="Alexandrium monilatum, Strain CCMP3105" /LENGTH=692 /DNA_ID=CAMNT_0016518751 /DNA_START=115 /DNA_END=2193 /DNA_ORIENTATION=-